MGFNDQVRNMAYGSESKKFIFQDGVRFKRMGGKNPIVFRLLPSFNPQDPNPCTSWLPFAMPATQPGATGDLTEWGRCVDVYRYVGHGKNRKDFLSLKGLSDGPDPLDCLLQAANSMPEWGYLTKDAGEGPNQIRKAIGRAASHLLCNIWDINQASRDVNIGVFTTSAVKALVDDKKGLVYQRNNVADEQIIAQNYLMQYANGDITDPNSGPAIMVIKGTDKGEKSDFLVYLYTDASNRLVRKGLDQNQMQQRYNMSNPASFLEIPTEEDTINQLVTLFNQRSPAGYHEYALLKMAFPTYQIPDAPSAPAASSMVGGGFGANPAAQRQAPVGQGVPASTWNQPGQQLPGIPAPQQVPQGIPQYTPQTQAQPQAQQFAPQAGIPQGIPPSAPQQTPEASRAAANMAAAGVQQQAPIVPGDQIPSVGIPTSQFSKEAFLAKLNASRAAAQS